MATFLKLCRCGSFKSVLLGGSFFPFIKELSHDVCTSETSKKMEIERARNQTGRDRLYLMFSTDESGAVSKELTSVLQTFYVGVFLGACYGGVLQARNAYLTFIERNKASSFVSHIEAKRALQDQVTINFGKGAFRWAWRMGLFTGTYVLLNTSISVYRGRSSFVEYVVAGGVTGAMYKVNLGLRGMLVGGGLGTAFGLVAGACSLGLMKLAGTTMEEMRYWQYEWQDNRDVLFRKAMRRSRTEHSDMDPFMEEREKILKSMETTSQEVKPLAAGNELSKTSAPKV